MTIFWLLPPVQESCRSSKLLFLDSLSFSCE
uniref:Uncharacterized protein n=1 Tax=Rhizophora mucronata TaxID=61149 RepID=A0A2P2QVG7_RHIMU